MERLSVSLKDNKDKSEIIRLTVGELQSTLTQRPGAQAIKCVLNFVYLGVVLDYNCIRTACFFKAWPLVSLLSATVLGGNDSFLFFFFFFLPSLYQNHS